VLPGFSMLAGAPCGALLLDHEGRVLEFNRAAEQLLGGPDGVLGSAALELLRARELEDSTETVLAELEGEDAAAVLYVRDVSHERAIEAELRRREVVGRSVRDAVIETDTALRIVRWNRAAELLYGWTAAEVVGRKADDVLRTELVADERDRLLDDLDDGGHVLMLARQRTADGTAIEVEASVISLRGATGDVTGYVAVNRDVSRRRRLEERLRATRHLETVARLAGGVAHDLNTLLTSVMGYAELLLGETDLPPRLRPDLEEIIGAADRAGTLTRQLLAFSRAQVLAPRPTDLNTIVTGSLAACRRLAGKNVRFVERLAPALASVNVDRGQIERVLLDVVTNAGEAMPEGGELTTRTAIFDSDGSGELPAGRFAQLIVSDSGVGMDEITRARAFEPFFTTKPGHTGLGLSSAHGTLVQSGGYLTLESAVDAGTTVTLSLPLLATPAGPQGAAGTATGTRAA